MLEKVCSGPSLVTTTRSNVRDAVKAPPTLWEQRVSVYRLRDPDTFSPIEVDLMDIIQLNEQGRLRDEENEFLKDEQISLNSLQVRLHARVTIPAISNIY